MCFIQKIKLVVLSALIALVATITCSLKAQVYYATVEKEGADTVLFVRKYSAKPTAGGNVLVVMPNELSNYGDYISSSFYRKNIKRAKLVVDNTFKPKTTRNWFGELENLEVIEGLTFLNTSEVTVMAFMFNKCLSLKGLDLTGFNTSKVTDFGSMFQQCRSLRAVDLSSFDFSSATNLTWMFNWCDSLEYVFVDNEPSKLPTSSSAYNNTFAACWNIKGVSASGEIVEYKSVSTYKDYFALADKGGFLTKKTNILAKGVGILPKSIYKPGEKLEIKGAWISRKVSFGNGQTYDIKFSPLEYLSNPTGFNPNTRGKQTLRVTYENKQYTFEVYVREKTDYYTNQISVVSAPSKTKYLLPFSEADLKLDGGMLSVKYSNEVPKDSTASLSMSALKYTVSGLNTNKEGEQLISINFNLGDTIFTYRYNITLVPALYVEEVSAPSKTKYRDANGELDLSGGVLRKVYEGGEREVLLSMDTLEYQLQSYDIVGAQIKLGLRFNLGDITFVYYYYITEVPFLRIEYVADSVYADMHTYKYSEILDSSGFNRGLFRKIYADQYGEDSLVEEIRMEDAKIDSLEFMFSWSNDPDRYSAISKLESGIFSVVFNLGDTTYKYIGNRHSIRYIEWKQYPSKTSYYLNEKIDLSDGLVVIRYDNFDGFDICSARFLEKQASFEQSVGLQKMSFYYNYDYAKQELLTGFDIMVYNPDIKSIEFLTKPNKTEYNFGEEIKLDEVLDGVIISLNYTDRKEPLQLGPLMSLLSLMEQFDLEIFLSAIKNNYGLEFELFNTNKLGLQRFAVRYGELECSCDIKVVDPIKEILVLSEPSLQEYKKPFSAEDLDLSGGVIAKIYENAPSDTFAMDTLEYIVLGDLEEINAGENTLVLNFDLGDTTFEWEYKINVLEDAAEDSTGGDEPGSGEEGGDEGGETPGSGDGGSGDDPGTGEGGEGGEEGGDDPIVAVEAAGFGGGSAFEAWTAGGVLSVKAERGGVLEVLGVNGVLLRRVEVAAGSSLRLPLERGVYVLRFGGEVKKVVVE